uniref:Glucuronosyltransferase n=1 Tax=Parascaris equorum TaxID=6256 RepID=A0A914RHW9_PAREQ
RCKSVRDTESIHLKWNFLFLLLWIIAVAEAANILIYSPSYSKSHLISNGRIADTLSKAGHNVVMFVPEYEQTNFTGTKYAKVIKMGNLVNISLLNFWALSMYSFREKLARSERDFMASNLTTF